MAPGPPPARTPGTSRTPRSCAASWAVARLWRHREQVTSVPAWGRRGRMPVAAPGPRRQSGPVPARHGVTAGAAVGQVPSAQVSAVHPQTGGRGTIPGQCRDPRPPCRSAVPAAGGRQRPLRRAPGGAAQRHLGRRLCQRHQPRHGHRRLPPAGLRGRGAAGACAPRGHGPRLAGLGGLREGGPLALAMSLGTLAPAGLRPRRGRPCRL